MCSKLLQMCRLNVCSINKYTLFMSVLDFLSLLLCCCYFLSAWRRRPSLQWLANFTDLILTVCFWLIESLFTQLMKSVLKGWDDVFFIQCFQKKFKKLSGSLKFLWGVQKPADLVLNLCLILISNFDCEK